MLITRVAAMALVLTGMSQESAQFQARSALAGVGFTTREAESVVCHPVRRRIIMLLMMAGSISVLTVIAALGVSLFTTFHAECWWWPLLLLLAGLLALGLFGKSRWMNKRVYALLAWGLHNWTDLDVRDYGSLLQLQNGFAVTEMLVQHGDWLEQKTLLKAALSHEGSWCLESSGLMELMLAHRVPLTRSKRVTRSCSMGRSSFFKSWINGKPPPGITLTKKPRWSTQQELQKGSHRTNTSWMLVTGNVEYWEKRSVINANI